MKTKNGDFFCKIDSEIKSYLLGFFVGDGSLSMPNEKRIRYDFRVSASERDKYIIDLYQKYISPSTDVKILSRKGLLSCIRGKEFLTKQDIYGVSISSKLLCCTLSDYGYGQNKTYADMHLPGISSDLMRHFIRGYFDADGVCIVTSSIRGDRKTDTNRIKPTFAIVAKNKSLLEDIQIHLLDTIGIDLKIYYEEKKGVYNLKTSSKAYLTKLYYYFYNDSEFYFERKRESFSKVMLTPREFRELKISQPRNA